MIAAPLFDSKNSFAFVIISVTTIYILHYAISYLMVKSRTVPRIFGGTAIPLIQGGVVLKQNMKKALFPIELLLSGLRQADAPNLAEVEAAVLETSGHVSVLKKPDSQPVTPKDLNIPALEAGLPVLLVNDGHVIKENLRKINQDESWLHGQLEKYGAMDLRDVYLAGIDGSGQMFYSLATTT
ncbi:MAG: YetF domain-containing protein [Desulfotomaculaceae bacterium]